MYKLTKITAQFMTSVFNFVFVSRELELMVSAQQHCGASLEELLVSSSLLSSSLLLLFAEKDTLRFPRIHNMQNNVSLYNVMNESYFFLECCWFNKQC